MRHVKAFTYIHKIPAVLSGKCTQTIRPQSKNGLRNVKVGDTALFHGWKCKFCNLDYKRIKWIRPDGKIKYLLKCPKCHGKHSYRRSKWSWRMEVEVSEIIDIGISEYGIYISSIKDFLDYLDFDTNMLRVHDQDFLHWEDRALDELARLDYINPPTGKELGIILNTFNNLKNKVVGFQIISWSKDSIKKIEV